MNDNKKNLVEAFSNLSLNDKRKELGRELAEATIVIHKLLMDVTNNTSQFDIDEFKNLYDGQLSENDYLTGFYEDFISYKELLSIYLDKIIDNYYE